MTAYRRTGYKLVEKQENLTPQQYRQNDFVRFDNYERAKKYFDTLNVDRKRIRLRADGSFHVVSYTRIKV